MEEYVIEMETAEEESVCKRNADKLTRGIRRKRNEKQKRKARFTAELRKKQNVKAERDGDFMYFMKNGFICSVRRSKLWKPM